MDSKKNIFLFKRNNIFEKKNRKKPKLKFLYYSIIAIIIMTFIILLTFIKIRKYTNNREKKIINEYNNKGNKELKRQMFGILSRISKQNITSLDNVYLGYYYKLGNSLIALNKVIFYCEILQCKRIFLKKGYYPLIKNTIYDKKYGLTIEILSNSNQKDMTSFFHWPHPYYTTLKIIPENRFDVFREEILNNLPKPSTDVNDLYIHIRNGDIYKEPNRGIYYAQPPLCFYEKVIEFKRFTNVYIIAVNDDYPIIQKLINEYKNTKYKRSSLKEDVSKLVYAYNIVASISSFLTSLIKLNDNLKYLWEYDIYHRPTKINHLHHSVSNFTRKYNIYQMQPSTIYKKTMHFWKRSDDQLNLMINDTCPNDFIFIKANK